MRETPTPRQAVSRILLVLGSKTWAKGEPKLLHTLIFRALAIVAVGAALAGCYIPDGKHPITTPSGSRSSGYGSDADTTTEAPLPSASQFRATLTEISRDCFGSAGCNVRYQITPSYIGSGGIPDGSYKILYSVSGCEDTKSGYITVRNGRYDTEEEYCSTSSDGRQLTARITQVLEN